MSLTQELSQFFKQTILNSDSFKEITNASDISSLSWDLLHSRIIFKFSSHPDFNDLFLIDDLLISILGGTEKNPKAALTERLQDFCFEMVEDAIQLKNLSNENEFSLNPVSEFNIENQLHDRAEARVQNEEANREVYS